jgi:hypothetical protein
MPHFQPELTSEWIDSMSAGSWLVISQMGARTLSPNMILGTVLYVSSLDGSTGAGDSVTLESTVPATSNDNQAAQSGPSIVTEQDANSYSALGNNDSSPCHFLCSPSSGQNLIGSGPTLFDKIEDQVMKGANWANDWLNQLTLGPSAAATTGFGAAYASAQGMPIVLTGAASKTTYGAVSAAGLFGLALGHAIDVCCTNSLGWRAYDAWNSWWTYQMVWLNMSLQIYNSMGPVPPGLP